MNDDVLRFEGVSKSFGGEAAPVDVLRNMQLALDEGEFLMVTGPSGSGKTTFLHLAALLDRPDRGRVILMGADTSGAAEAALCESRAERLGIVFQRYALLPGRTALENVLFRFRYTRHDERTARRLAYQALERVHLDDIADRPARVLSGGEMQRVAIARAIAVRPPLLVADEPTGNLDGSAAVRIMEVFRELHATGLTILMVTHNLQLLDYGSRHLTLENGAFVEKAS